MINVPKYVNNTSSAPKQKRTLDSQECLAPGLSPEQFEILFLGLLLSFVCCVSVFALLVGVVFLLVSVVRARVPSPISKCTI